MDTLTYVSRDTMADIATVIRSKNGSETVYKPTEMAVAISALGASKSDVINFIDYNGTLLYSYSLDDIQSLTMLPDLPSHDGLICQGWNWTLEELQSVASSVTVGATYITDDGATRLNITIETTGRMNVPLCLYTTDTYDVYIDWGDESNSTLTPESLLIETTHSYTSPGDYTISISTDDGNMIGLGKNDSSYCVMGENWNEIDGSVYMVMLRSVNIGSNVTSISDYAFCTCLALMNITIPNGVTSIGEDAFNCCYALTSVTIPDGVISIGVEAFNQCLVAKNISVPNSVTDIDDDAFFYCTALTSVTIPNGVTSIGERAFLGCTALTNINISNNVISIESQAFYSCYSLTSITIPDGITSISDSTFLWCCSLTNISIPDNVISIGAGAFRYCSSMAEYHLKPTTPPTLSDTNAFTGIPDDCIIYVPQGSLDAYQSATNWSTYAGYMQEETE